MGILRKAAETAQTWDDPQSPLIRPHGPVAAYKSVKRGLSALSPEGIRAGFTSPQNAARIGNLGRNANPAYIDSMERENGIGVYSGSRTDHFNDAVDRARQPLRECAQCGAPAGDSDRFCGNCGTAAP